ncbi:hypothetical protein B0H14DRAFT_2885010 [Mycena olivaceomarginata]|nr:hypothetical protein B0H14DRAFT_2885010 [Mycena olivaceomarginata]
MARSETPCRLFAFMELFLVSSGAGSSSRMLVSPERVLRRMTRDWCLTGIRNSQLLIGRRCKVKSSCSRQSRRVLRQRCARARGDNS